MNPVQIHLQAVLRILIGHELREFLHGQINCLVDHFTLQLLACKRDLMFNFLFSAFQQQMTFLFGIIDDLLFFQFPLGNDSVPNLVQVFAALFPLPLQFIDTVMDRLLFRLDAFDVLFDLTGFSL